jgi:hypothetical protein
MRARLGTWFEMTLWLLLAAGAGALAGSLMGWAMEALCWGCWP